MADPTIQHITNHARKKAYKRLDRIRARIKRERIMIHFHGEESFAAFIADVHLETLNRERADLIRFLDRD